MEPSALCRRILAWRLLFPGEELDAIGAYALIAVTESPGESVPGLDPG